MSKITLGEKIRALRKNRKWTLGDLSERTEVSQAFLSGLERGDKVPRLETLEKIAEAFNVSPALLQHPDVSVERLREVSDILQQLSDLPDDKLDLVKQILEGLRK